MSNNDKLKLAAKMLLNKTPMSGEILKYFQSNKEQVIQYVLKR